MYWIESPQLNMKIYILLIIILLPSCVNNHKNDSSTYRNEDEEIISMTMPVDSIELYLEPEGKDQENLSFYIYNSNSDTIIIYPTYYISNQSTPMTYMVIGKILEQPQKILPQKILSFKINLGLDSIEYCKKDTYNVTILGKNKNKNIFFYKSLKLGNRYKINGTTILEPDTVIFPISYIN